MKTETEFRNAIRIVQETDPIRDKIFDSVKDYMARRFKEDASWRGVGEDHAYFPRENPSLRTFKVISSFKVGDDRVDAVMVGGASVVDYSFPLADLWTPWEEVSKKFSK